MINNYVYFTLQWSLNTKSCNIQGAMKILPYVWGGLIAGLLVGRGKKVKFRGIFRDSRGNFAGISREFSRPVSLKNADW